MTVKIMDYCIRCGLCVDLCPKYFSFNLEEDRIDPVSPIEDGAYEEIKQMALDCAVSAISVKRN